MKFNLNCFSISGSRISGVQQKDSSERLKALSISKMYILDCVSGRACGKKKCVRLSFIAFSKS